MLNVVMGVTHRDIEAQRRLSFFSRQSAGYRLRSAEIVIYSPNHKAISGMASDHITVKAVLKLHGYGV
jgi:hypothetical protein